MLTASQDNENKFQFDIEFQEEVLQLTVTDLRLGQKIITLFDDHYFTLVEHGIVAAALKSYYKKNARIPSRTVIKEELKLLYNHRDYKKSMDDTDKSNITKVINKIYKGVVKDPMGIYEKVKFFSRYISFRDEIEKIDLKDFGQYESYHKLIHKAITKGSHLEEDKGVFIVEDARARINSRHSVANTHPTPYWQLNRLINGGGTTSGNVICVMGPAKRFKTGFVINLARGYMRLRKRVLIADFENGEDSLSLRYDQSILGVSHNAVTSGQMDDKLLKTLRKYKRFGAECVIKRFPAGTTASHIGIYIDTLRDEYGIIITELIVDYGDLLGASTGVTDETPRVSQAYIDLKNLGNEKKLNSIWTPSHVTREGGKNQGKKYQANDVAKAIDKVRHADMILGINQDEDEIENNVMRVEIVDQRNGPQNGRILFHVSYDHQRLTEFLREEVREYEDQLTAAGDSAPKPSKFTDAKKSDI